MSIKQFISTKLDNTMIFNVLKKGYLITCILFLIGCANNNNQRIKNNYYYSWTGESEKFGTKIYDPIKIEAENDSLAYVHALGLFESSQESLSNSDHPELMFIPVSFNLTNQNGDLISFPEIETPKMKQKQKEYELEQKKAYAGAEFGMSKKQVLALEHFDKWYDNSNSITKRETIGNQEYNVNLNFLDDELYLVTFETYHQSAVYIDTEIKKAVQNLKEVIQESYGDPSEVYGIPDILRLKAGYISWAYKWSIGTKTIAIGIEETSWGAEYNMHAEIRDNVRTNRINEQNEALKTENIQNSSSLF